MKAKDCNKLHCKDISLQIRIFFTPVAAPSKFPSNFWSNLFRGFMFQALAHVS